MNDYHNSECYPDPTPFHALANIENDSKKHRYRPIVYICSKFRGDLENNIECARKYCRFAIDSGYIPIAPHLLYPQFLDDDSPAEREIGKFCGIVLLSHVKEVWVFGDEFSEGMEEELKFAKSRNKQIRYFTDDLKEKGGRLWG